MPGVLKPSLRLDLIGPGLVYLKVSIREASKSITFVKLWSNPTEIEKPIPNPVKPNSMSKSDF